MEMKLSPTKIDAQVSPSSTTILRASVHECKGASVHKNGAECWVRCSDFSPHATSFSQWLVTEIDERRIHSAKTLFATRHSLPSRQEHCHP